MDVLACVQTPDSKHWYRGSAEAVARSFDSVLDPFRYVMLGCIVWDGVHCVLLYIICVYQRVGGVVIIDHHHFTHTTIITHTNITHTSNITHSHTHQTHTYAPQTHTSTPQTHNRGGDRAEDLIILSGQAVYRMDFAAMVNAHRMSGADITLATYCVSKEDAERMGVVHVDPSTRMCVYG